MAELEKKLAKRLEESIGTRNAQRTEIKQLQAELQKRLSNIPRRPRESIPQLDQQIRDLEHKRTITSMSLADERKILKEIHSTQKAKTQVEAYLAMDRQVQEVKMKLDELKSGQTTQRESIQEIETGLSRVKLANQLGCETQELTTITVECPKAKLGMIIGKQGANIQKLMEKYKVTIDVDKGTCIATLTGGAAAVEAAKAEIESISQSIETEITLPAETITYLTGQHSQELGTLKSKYEDIYVDVVRGTGKVAIRGNPERCEEAKKEILTLDVVSNTQVLVGREFNYLLGHKGSRINDLVQTHKVVIDVKRNKEEDTATAIVIGLASRVADTMEAIQELMDNNREVVERLAVDSVLKNILLAVAGKHIKALQSNVNEKLKEDDDTATCYLSFPKERQDSPELLVKAKQSVIESATALTEAALRELQGLILTFTVDPYIVPRILGKGGETIKKLTNGKPLFLEVERSSGKVVVGATTPEGRESLLSEVKQIVAENSVLRVPGDPDLMKSQYRELSRSKTKAALQQLVWVDIDESKNVFILRGKQEDLEKAKAMLEEYLASNSLDEVTVMDDDYDVLLTGGKGSKLVKMSKELEVSMSADQSKGTITLRGHPDNVTKAKAMLRTFLNGGEGQSVAKVVASDQVVGTIIGKGGQTRKDLESKYEVSIHISKDTYRVSIRGPEDKVQECRLEILKMISAARVTQVVSISAEQQAKLQKNDVLKRITQETHSQLSVAEDKVTVRGFFHDVRDAVSLLNEKLTGEYTSSLELDSSQFSRVSATCRDSSHLQRIESATEAKVELVASSGEIRLRGKRSNVRKGKEQIYDFLAFVCPGESQRLKITKPLYQTVGQPTSLAEVSAAVGGSTIYLDRDTSSIVIRDASAGKVEAAAKLVATKIKDAGRLAYILEIAPHEAWLVSYVIGKNGGRIQSLQKGSDCHLDVSKESRTITVTGESDEKVSKVREKLDALVAKARRENVLVRIPEKAIPAFVGHGGKKIKDLSKEHAVEIQRVRKSSQFKIIGDETKVASAKTFIDDWVDRWQESNASVEMKVEKHYVSAILGQKGSTTRAIEKDFDCKIDLDREALTLTIRGGDKEKRQNALEKIKEVMATEAATQAERAAKKKESAKTKEDESPSDPSDSLKVVARSAPVPPASEAASNTKPQAKPNGKKKESNPFPSKPIGMELVSKKKEGKPANAKQSMDGGTEQGHNLFNLLVGE